jgi:hypothetical protein
MIFKGYSSPPVRALLRPQSFQRPNKISARTPGVGH